MMLLESVCGPPSPGHMSRRCHTLTWREITLFITSLVTLGRAAVNCYDSLTRGAGEPLHYPSLPSSPSPWVFNSMFWPSCAQHPRSCLHSVSDICMLGSCQSRCSSHLTIGRSDEPRLNICQNFLHRHFCGDGSSLWHSLHNIAPSVTSFYQSTRHVETSTSATSAIPGLLTLLVLHVPLSVTRVSHLITHVAAV